MSRILVRQAAVSRILGRRPCLGTGRAPRRAWGAVRHAALGTFRPAQDARHAAPCRGEWSHPPADPSPQRGHKESEARVEATVWCMGCIMGWITVEHGGEKRVDPGWIRGGSGVDPGWIRGVDQGWIRVDQGGSGWIRRGKSCVEGRKCMQNVGGCTQAEYRLAGETVPSIIKERKRPVSSSCRRGGTAGASGVVPSRILGRRL